jgi:hypothetical protein
MDCNDCSRLVENTETLIIPIKTIHRGGGRHTGCLRSVRQVQKASTMAGGVGALPRDIKFTVLLDSVNEAAQTQ